MVRMIQSDIEAVLNRQVTREKLHDMQSVADEAQRKLLRELRAKGKEATAEYGFYDGSLVVLSEDLKPIYRALKMVTPKH